MTFTDHIIASRNFAGCDFREVIAIEVVKLVVIEIGATGSEDRRRDVDELREVGYDFAGGKRFLV